MLWSEAFLGHHRRPWWRYALAAALRMPVDTTRWHLLAIGGRPAAEDYYATGSRRWRCWRFAFATEGLGYDVTTSTVQDPIIAFVFGQQGLMGGLTLQGSKITKVTK